MSSYVILGRRLQSRQWRILPAAPFHSSNCLRDAFHPSPPTPTPGHDSAGMPVSPRFPYNAQHLGTGHLAQGGQTWATEEKHISLLHWSQTLGIRIYMK